MCGIIGYIGKSKAAPILFEGLKKLEYRGYDSAGISKVKKVNFLKQRKKSLFMKSNNGPNNLANSCFQKFKNIPTKDSMNILNFIKFERYYCRLNPLFQKSLKEKISNYSQIAKKINVSSTTISRVLNIENYWINFQMLLNIARLYNIPKNEIFQNIRHIKTYNSFPVSFDIKNLLSPAFFRVVGHIIGDGGIHAVRSEGKYRPFYVNNDEILLNSFKSDVQTVFGNVRIYFRKRADHGDEFWLPTTLGILFYGFMEYEKNDIKRIPSFVYNIQNSKLTGSLLQALYDDEGYIYPQKYMIVISQKYKDLVNDIREVVKKIGIKPNRILINKPRNRTLMHYFSITGKENIILFAKKVGFLHPEKKKKLEILVKKYRGK